MTRETMDVVIIGAGPAGLQAALHASRKKASVLVIGRPERSSIFQAHVENYLGVDGVTSGSELMRIATSQVSRFGVRLLAEDVLHIIQEEGRFVIKVESGREIFAYTLIIATGTARKKLKVKGEKELLGRGVSYCVDCDANFFRKARVAVVGNESAAADGALTLLGYASEVFLIAKELVINDELHKKLLGSGVQLRLATWVKEIIGEQAVTGLLLDDDTVLTVDGVFIELGAKGAIELANNLGVLLDTETFTHIVTNRRQQTNIAGVFAAGDITGHPYQMAKAVGEGCVAGLEAANYSHRLHQGENPG